MKAATTRTGRPKLGGSLEVLSIDGDVWIPATIRVVADGHDQHGQGVINVILELHDEIGGVTPFERWDGLTWRAVKP